ncbi:MAG: LysE family transporter [Deltaproteobacteria bacterium]|nr:LysE family transporter [Deltaproteobacteria bacterium]
MTSEISFFISGTVFGLSNGLIPGPLLMLVITESLKHGGVEGIKVAIAPLLADLPIVVGTIFILSRLNDILPLLGSISILGGFFIIYLAIESLTFKGSSFSNGDIKPSSIRKGVITNFLNPSPYLFWISIGAPTVVRAAKISALSVFLFIFSMYLFLVGSKIILAVLTGKSRHFIKSRYYLYTVRGLGIILLIFSFFFFKNGLRYFGWY